MTSNQKPTTMFKILQAYVLVMFVFLLGCSSEEVPVNLEESVDVILPENVDDEEPFENVEDELETPLTTILTTYIFGHSLLVHDPPLIATPSNETTVPHWMAELSATAEYEFSVAGQYGFLPQHANLPPMSQWGFDSAVPAWESDLEAFSEADFNSILITAGNFVQYQPATMPYDGDNPSNTSPLIATLDILDWVENQEPGTSFYIYENWPDMAPFLNNGVPATSMEFSAYNDYTLGEFHNWWLDYHQNITIERPDLNVKMIPVGPIISRLLTETNLSEIEFSELYEDDAPHGRPTIYFLASLVTYMAMYGLEAPENFEVPNTVDQTVANNYNATAEFIWNALNDYVDENGKSLVFP